MVFFPASYVSFRECIDRYSARLALEMLTRQIVNLDLLKVFFILNNHGTSPSHYLFPSILILSKSKLTFVLFWGVITLWPAEPWIRVGKKSIHLYEGNPNWIFGDFPLVFVVFMQDPSYIYLVSIKSWIFHWQLSDLQQPSKVVQLQNMCSSSCRKAI